MTACMTVVGSLNMILIDEFHVGADHIGLHHRQRREGFTVKDDVAHWHFSTPSESGPNKWTLGQ